MKYDHRGLVRAVNSHFSYNGEIDISQMPITQKKEMISHFRKFGDLEEHGRSYRSVMENLVDALYIEKKLKSLERAIIYEGLITPDLINLTHCRAIYLQEKGFQVVVREARELIALLVSKKIQGAVQNA